MRSEQPIKFWCVAIIIWKSNFFSLNASFHLQFFFLIFYITCVSPYFRTQMLNVHTLNFIPEWKVAQKYFFYFLLAVKTDLRHVLGLNFYRIGQQIQGHTIQTSDSSNTLSTPVWLDRLLFFWRWTSIGQKVSLHWNPSSTYNVTPSPFPFSQWSHMEASYLG